MDADDGHGTSPEIRESAQTSGKPRLPSGKPGSRFTAVLRLSRQLRDGLFPREKPRPCKGGVLDNADISFGIGFRMLG